MKRIIGKLIRTAIWGSIAAVIVIGVAPFYRVYQQLLPAFDSARAAIKANTPTEAIATLDQYDAWVGPHPALIRESTRLRVRAHIALQQKYEAALAITTMENRLTAPPLPAAQRSPRELIQTPALAIINPDLNNRFGAPSTTELVAALHKEIGIAAPPVAEVVDKAPESSDEELAPVPTPSFYMPVDFPAWAVVRTPKASSRNMEGKVTGKLGAGAVLSVTGPPHVSRNIELYPCIRQVSANAALSFYVSSTNLDFHPGPLEEADGTILELAVKRARIIAALHALEHPVSKVNPYAPLIVKVKEQRSTLITQVRSTKVKRDKSSGSARIDANETLQSLRTKLAALDNKERTLRDQMAEWQGKQETDEDRQTDIERLRKALDAITAKLAALEPAL